MLTQAVQAYLALRRACGFKLRSQGYLLRSFAAFSDARDQPHVCAATAFEWAGLAPSIIHRAHRLAAVIRFTRHMRAEDPSHELPPAVASWFSSGPPSWMLLLFDPHRQLPASTELIARDLSVSMREAEVAALLVNDYDIKVVAQRLNMSIHTARTHLKTIFSKTGSHSQVELICRIARGPAGIHTDSTRHRTVPQP